MGTGYLSRTVGQSPFRHSSGLLLRVSCTAVNPFDRPQCPWNGNSWGQIHGDKIHGDRLSIGGIHGDRLSIEFMGTGYLSRTVGQSPFRHSSGSLLRVSCTAVNPFDRPQCPWNESFHSNSWGQVIYRGNSWGQEFMGTGYLSNSWGQVIYREPWGNRPFGTHPVCSSGSVARRLTLSTDLSAPGTGIHGDKFMGTGYLSGEFMGTGYLSNSWGQIHGDRLSIENRGAIALSALIRFAPAGQLHGG
jgi:hypothetical protein